MNATKKIASLKFDLFAANSAVTREVRNANNSSALAKAQADVKKISAKLREMGVVSAQAERLDSRVNAKLAK